MRTVFSTAVAAVLFGALIPMVSTHESGMQAQNRPPASFKNDVAPIIKKHCLPCHAEDNYNPSGLSLDTYELLMAGGEHGKAVDPGNGAGSMLVKKLGPEPPFGKTMPVVRKKQQAEGVVNKVSDEEMKALVEWIDQGAKNN